MNLFLTGASGYIGSHLTLQAIRCGHTVRAGTRRPVAEATTWSRYALEDTDAFDLPPGTDAVIHLAASLGATSLAPEVEIAASERLIDGCRRAGVKFVFVSSQAATATAPTSYGQTKWRIEALTTAAGGVVVRPGQVVGGAERGLFGTLVGIVRALPVLPRFLPAPLVQPIHLEDLGNALIAAAGPRGQEGRVYRIGSATAVPFTHFLQRIAVLRLHRYRLFVPVPTALVRLVNAALGPRLGHRTGVSRLISLFDLPYVDSGADLAALGIVPRTLDAALARSGQVGRRLLLEEGRAVLAYVSHGHYSMDAVRRYVRLISSVRDGTAVGLPRFLIKRPSLLALLDRPGRARAAGVAELAWRLDAAVLLSEASILGATRFLSPGMRQSGFLYTGIIILLAIMREIGWRMLQIPFGPLLRGLLAKTGSAS